MAVEWVLAVAVGMDMKAPVNSLEIAEIPFEQYPCDWGAGLSTLVDSMVVLDKERRE